MKIKITTTAVTLIWLMTCFSSAAVAVEEAQVSSSASRSPLMPNFYPAAGQWILNSGLVYDDTTSKSWYQVTKTLANATIRIGITDRTEFRLSQAHLLDREPSVIKSGFYSPDLSISHRFSETGGDIFGTFISYTPATDKNSLMQNKEQVRLSLNYSKFIDNEYWITGEVTDSRIAKRHAAVEEESGSLLSEVDSVTAQLKLSKKIHRTAYSIYGNVTHKDQYEFVPIWYGNCFSHAPACTAYTKGTLSPSLGIELSHDLMPKTFVVLSYSVSQQNRTAVLPRNSLVVSQENFRQILGIYLVNEF
jgi:hypothetical protein